MTRWFSVLLIVGLVGTINNSLQANEIVIDPRLDAALGKYLMERKIDVTNNGKKLDEVLRLLTERRVSPCELSSELGAKGPADLKKIEYLLRDIVETKTRQIEISYRLILERLATRKPLDESDRQAVKRLAIQTAAMSTSLTELRESIIPKMFDGITAKLDRAVEIQDKVDFLDLELRRNVASICDRLAVLEDDYRQRQQYGSDYQVMMQPQLNNLGPSAITEPRSVNRTKWEPQGYATSEQLCSNPKPGPTNVYFDTDILTSQGWKPHRHFGDIWIDCSGRIVMILKK